jgi:hypothetical protein
VNADIILMSDFVRAVTQVARWGRQALIIGRRWDLDVREPLDFTQPDWEERLRARLADCGTLHHPVGIDYFVFSRNTWGEIPPFAIGRTAWDNWLVYGARSLGGAVVDATQAITAVHQSHDYSHHPMKEEGVWGGTEYRRNHELVGGKYRQFTVQHATHLLTPDGLRPARSFAHLYCRLERLPEIHPGATPIVQIVVVLRTLRAVLLSTWARLKALIRR